MSEIRSACVCNEKNETVGGGANVPFSYPTPGRDGSARELIEKNGYMVVRGLITQAEVESTRADISAIVREWYAEFQRTASDGNDWEEVVNRMPAWKEGDVEPADPEMGIRRLFRMAVKREYFARLARHEKVGGVTPTVLLELLLCLSLYYAQILPLVADILGPNVKLLQSMSLLKPPGYF